MSYFLSALPLWALILAVVVVGVLLAVTWGGLGTAIQAAIDKVTTAITP